MSTALPLPVNPRDIDAYVKISNANAPDVMRHFGISPNTPARSAA